MALTMRTIIRVTCTCAMLVVSIYKSSQSQIQSLIADETQLNFALQCNMGYYFYYSGFIFSDII